MLRMIALCGLAMFAVSCSMPPAETQTNPSTAVVLYEGARLIPGNGSAPIESAAMLVENGMITRIGRKGSIDGSRRRRPRRPHRKTVMPTLINAHGHPGFQRGLTYSADNFTRETDHGRSESRAVLRRRRPSSRRALKRASVMYEIRADQEAGS